MTRDEWCHLAAHRTPVTVTMHGIPDAPATLIGWHNNRWARVEFTNGNRASIRPERVLFHQVTGNMRGTENEAQASAVNATPRPLDAVKERRD